MAYSSTIKLVVGDTLPVLNFTLKDSNTAASGATLDSEDSDTWAPIDLTGVQLGYVLVKWVLLPFLLQ